MTAALKPTAGAGALLFERLIDLEPDRSGEPYPFRIVDADAMLGSIRRELARLIGTRRPVGIASARREEELTVLEYGLPDITGLSPRSIGDRLLIARTLERIIAAYEPRLRHVAVTVDPDPAAATRLVARIAGERVVGTVVQTVSFPLALDGAGPDGPDGDGA